MLKTQIIYLNSLTSVRGIAAILIVIHHFSKGLLPFWGDQLASYTFLIKNSYLCVDFFFVLSGFILAHVYLKSFNSGVIKKDYKSFIFSRFSRIYPLHLLTLLFLVGLEILRLIYFMWLSSHNPSQLTNSDLRPPFSENYSLISLLMNIVMLQAFDLINPPLFDQNTYWNQPAWSISAEWCIYLIVPFLLCFLWQKKAFLNGLIYGLALILFCLIFKSGKLDLPGILSIVRCGAECTIGILTYQVYQSNIFQEKFKQDWLGIMAFLSIILIMHFNQGITLILPFVSIFLLSCSFNEQFINKFLSSKMMFFLGTISYSIYMVHWLIQDLIRTAWKLIFHQSFGTELTVNQATGIIIILVGLVIICSTLTYYLLELPLREKLKKTYFAKKYVY